MVGPEVEPQMYADKRRSDEVSRRAGLFFLICADLRKSAAKSKSAANSLPGK